MNTFKLDIKNDGNGDTPEYYLNLIIDGHEFLKTIDEDFNVVFFEALKGSSSQSGNYLIFTCSCGIADCGGWEYVKVTHRYGIIHWDFRYVERFHFEFLIDNYKDEIARIELKVKNENLILEPVTAIGPE